MSFKRLIVGVLLVLGLSVSLSASKARSDLSLNIKDDYYINAIQKSKLNGFGKGRIIAVLDTGINDNNPELKGKVIAEYDFTTNSSKAIDKDGHGTKIASIIASANDGKGITGIAYNAKLIDVKVVDNNGKIDNSNIIKGIEFAVKHGANVINMSFASGGYSQKLQDVITKYAKKGIIFVAAAGNNGEKALTYPAAYDGVIAVGALDRKTEKRAIYSNYGKWVDKWVKDGIWTYDGEKFSREYGTSEACAVVSGIVNDNVTKKANKDIKIKNDNRITNTYNINDVSIFADDHENTYLHDLANYNIIQARVKALALAINKLHLESIPSYSFNPFPSIEHEVKLDKLDTVNAYWVLFDLFDDYNRFAIKAGEKEPSVTEEDAKKLLENYTKLLEDTIKVIEKPNQDIDHIEKKLNELVLKTKGKTDPFSKLIRKWTNYVINGIKNKDITKYRTHYLSSALPGKIEKYKKSLKFVLTGLKKFTAVVKDLEISLKAFEGIRKSLIINKLYRSEINLIDFLTAMAAYNRENSSSLMKKMVEVSRDAINYKKGNLSFYLLLGEVAKIAKESLSDDAYKYAKDKTVEFITDKLPGKSFNVLKGVVAQSVVDIISSLVNESAEAYMYLVYRNLLAENDKKSYYKRYGSPLTVTDANNNFISISIVHKFLNHAMKYLLAMASDPLNVNQLQTERLTSIVDKYKVEDYGIKYKFDSSKIMQNIDNAFYFFGAATSNLAIDGAVFVPHLGTWSAKALEQLFGIKDKKKLKIGIEDYLNSIDFAGNPNYKNYTTLEKLQTILNGYSEMSQVIYDYQYVLGNLLANKITVKAVVTSYLNNDKEIEKIMNSAEEINDKIVPKNIDPDFTKSLILFKKETNYCLVTKRELTTPEVPVSRKLFVEMMMKATDQRTDKYENPYDDTQFLLNLFSENKITLFKDIDKKDVTLNEKLWIEYANYKDIVKGYDGDRAGDFGPNDKLLRHQAMIIVGKILKKNGFKYNKQEANNVIKKLGLHITGKDLNIYNNYKEWIGLCLQTGVIRGYKDKTLGLDKLLTNYQTSVVAVRLYGALKKIKNQYSIFNYKKGKAGEYYDSYSPAADLHGIVPRIFLNPSKQEIPALKSGSIFKFAAKSNIPEKYKDKVSVQWMVDFGNLDGFKKYIDGGYISTSVTFHAPKTNVSIIVPVVVKYQYGNYKSISRKYYIRVVPDDGDDDPYANDTPRTDISVLYLKSEDSFRVSWEAKNAEAIEILYSFDQKNWSRFDKLNLQNYQGGDSYTAKIPSSLQHDKIYFKVISTSGANRTISRIYELAYKVATADTGEKNSELPAKALLHSLKNTTRHEYAIPSWYTVKDSHGKDNAESYELSYADNAAFENDTRVNVGDVRTYRIDGLQDEKRYYFRVRAINKVGTGDWSDYESTTIDLEHLPDFDTGYQVPANGATGVSKMPVFKWKASDRDDDPLEYYVRIGTDPDNLKYSSGWIRDKSAFEFASEYSKALKPNTKYYWQVTYREGHHTRNYYGGEYPKSPMWSFTTEGTGPDLAVTGVRMLDNVELDKWIRFEVTVKNNGTETADDSDIKPYFVKEGKENEFAAYKIGHMHHQLNPGEEETVVVKVQFSNKLETRTIKSYVTDPPTEKVVTYDNILTDGNNTVRFKLDYNQFDVDTNAANDAKDYIIQYSMADNLPKITYDDLILNNLSDRKGDYRYMLGWKVTYQIEAEDQVKINKYEIEYRTSENDTWHHIQTYTNDDEDINDRIEWIIPNDKNLVTQTMQLRVKVYNPSGKYSSITSPQFKVFENNVNISELVVDKSNYKQDDPLIITYSIDSQYPIDSFTLRLKQENGGSETLYRYRSSDASNKLADTNSLQFVIPRDQDLIGDKAYIEAYVIDENGAYKKVESTRFSIVQNNEAPKPFSPYLNVFDQIYHFPDDASDKRTENYIKKVMIDDDSLVHLLIEQEADWFGKKANGQKEDEMSRHWSYFYMTYDPKTGDVSAPQKMFENEKLNSGSLPDEMYRDFIVQSGVPILVTWNSANNDLKKYQLGNGAVTSNILVSNQKYDNFMLINHNNKAYLVYRELADSVENRRHKVMEIYPNIGSSSNILDQYISGLVRIANESITFFTKGISYKLDADLHAILSSKQTFPKTLDNDLEKSAVSIYDTEIRDAYLDNNKTLWLVKNNNDLEQIASLNDMDDYHAKMKIGVYHDKVVVVYVGLNKSTYKILVHMRTTGENQFVELGRYVESHGTTVSNVDMNSKGKIIIANPDGHYDSAAQLTFADLTMGLKTFPDIIMERSPIEIEKGAQVELKWHLSQSADAIDHYEVYKIVHGNRTKIATINDHTVTKYVYTQANTDEDFVTIEIRAVGDNGESKALIPFQVIGKVSFDSFSADHYQVNLHETLKLTWTVSGANGRNTYTGFRKCADELEWTPVFKTKKTYFDYRVEGFSGECDFKVQSGSTEAHLPESVAVEGDFYGFKKKAFAPKGTYDAQRGVVHFTWATYFDAPIQFTVYVKKEGASDFVVAGKTTKRTYDYQYADTKSFDWKVAFKYEKTTIESPIMHVDLHALMAPTVDALAFAMKDNIPTVHLKFSKVSNATDYDIYRKNNGVLFLVGTVPSAQNYFDDANIEYGESYDYRVVARNAVLTSLPSPFVHVDAAILEPYDVIFDTPNYQILPSNAVTLQMRPSKHVTYESYELLIGTDPKEMVSYGITNKRVVNIDGLKYGQTYYIEAYPLDYEGHRVSTTPAKLTFTTGFDKRELSGDIQVSVDAVSTDGISISWDSLVNTDYYAIYRSEDGQKYEYLGTTTNTSYNDYINLEYGKAYRYIVKAVNGNTFKKSTPTIAIVVPEPDTDGDGHVDSKDAFPNDPHEWLDTDHDGTGDNADTDDDNDGINDTDELKYGLNPKDPSDAAKDSDGDGISNIDEIRHGTNPTVSDAAVQVTLQKLDDLYVLVNAQIPPITLHGNVGNGADAAYSVVSDHPDIVSASVDGALLTLTPLEGASGTARITVTAKYGNKKATQAFTVTVKDPKISEQEGSSGDYKPIEGDTYETSVDGAKLHAAIDALGHVEYHVTRNGTTTQVQVTIPGAEVKVAHDGTATVTLPTGRSITMTVGADGRITPHVEGVPMPSGALPAGTTVEAGDHNVTVTIPLPETLTF